MASTYDIFIGGALGIVGVITGQAFGLFAGWRDRRHKVMVHRKEQLEKLVDLVGKSQQWLWKLKLVKTFSEYQQCTPPVEIRQVVMLARLSFPLIVKPAANWANSYVDFYNLVVDVRRQEEGKTLGTLVALAAEASSAPEHWSKLPEIRGNILDNAIIEEAKEYLDL